jgi:hypothetical protein
MLHITAVLKEVNIETLERQECLCMIVVLKVNIENIE